MKLKFLLKFLIGKITHCYNYGKNNRVIFVKNGKPHKRIFMPKGLTVFVDANNCTVTIEKPLSFQNTSIYLEGDNAEFSIEKSLFPVRDAKFYVDKNSKILIGRNSQLKNRGLVMISNNAYEEPVVIALGDNVYIARDVLIRASDGHTVIDANTKEPLNPAENVIIEDNVWIGSRAVILKGAHISKGSIVGACSLVNKKFDEENVVIAGIPAKVIRHNVTWDRRGYENYKKNVYENIIKLERSI